MILTSLSPNHKNASNQHEALKSWQSFGKVYSLNSPQEIDILEKEYSGLTFVETDNTIERYINKPLVSINAFIDFAILKEESLLLINSDIVIDNLPKLNEDGITILSRYDYLEDITFCKKFEYGFDVAYVPNRFLNIFQLSIYGLGACWWDLFLPFTGIQRGVPIYSSHSKHIFHKIHPAQYSYQEWEYFAAYFKKQFGIDKKQFQE